MEKRFLIGAATAMALVLAMGGANAPHAQEAPAVGEPTVTQPDAVLSSEEVRDLLEEAAQDGTLEATVTQLVEGAGSVESVGAITAALSELAGANPALAAETAQFVASAAQSLAENNPQAALDLASASLSVVTNPAVQAAAPAAAAAAAVNSAGTAQLATGFAQAQGSALNGVDAVDAKLAAVQQSQALADAQPGLLSDMAEAVELAVTQVELAGIETAAGGPAAGGAVGGGIPAGVGGGAAPAATPAPAAPPPGPVATGGAAVVPLGNTAVASPI